MKNLLYFIAPRAWLIILSVIVYSSITNCRKEYPENPRTFNLTYDPYKQMVGNWVVQEFKINGVDAINTLPFPPDQVYSIIVDKDYLVLTAQNNNIYYGGPFTVSTGKKGSGNFIPDVFDLLNDTIQLPPNGPFLSYYNKTNPPPWKILKLYKGELKCSNQFNNNQYFTFMRKK